MRIALFLIAIAFTSCMKVDDAIQTNFVPTAPSSGSSFCPTNYVRVPALSPYTTEDFCVSKYEMKILGQANGDQVYNAAFVADSRADGTPWVSLTRDSAVTECAALGTGYELMTNGDWQTLARNIEGVAWNWSNATIGDAGGLSRSVGMAAGVAADVDSNSCVNTGNSCDLSTWNARRRVHQLSNGSYVWDVGGNVGEWVRDDSNHKTGNVVISQVTNAAYKQFYGPSGDYSALNADPHGGLGDAIGVNSNNTLCRGGAWGAGMSGAYNAGIFGFNSGETTAYTDSSVGFRCVYRTPAAITTDSLLPSYVLPVTPTTADATDYDLGVKFTPTVNGTVTAIRFYRGSANAAGYTVKLWSAGGALLETGTGSDGTIPGWQQINLNNPVAVTGGTTYVASYYTSNGLYASHSGFFTSTYTNLSGNLSAPLTAGVYNVGPGFPTSTFGDNHYYVDVVFAP